MAQILRTVVTSCAVVQHFCRSHRFAQNSMRLQAGACRLWSRCLTGRVFGFTVWATIAVALLVPAAPASTQTDSMPEGSASSSTSERIVPATVDAAGRSATPAATGGQRLIVTGAREAAAMLSDCWGASRMRVQEAWQAAGPLTATMVAVLDTGIDCDCAHLRDRVVASVVLVDSPAANDVYGHGTHVADTIAAIAPNCQLLNVKIADDRGFCDAQRVAEGIRIAADRGAAVINLSLQVETSPDLEAAVAYAWDKGAVLVAAAGMPPPTTSRFLGTSTVTGPASGPCRPAMSPPVYPASYACVIAVTGTNELDELAPVSNRAVWVDVAAPGYRTLSEMPGGERGYLTGTSSAAAHVAGLAALLCGVAEDTNGNGRINDEVRNAIESSAKPIAVDGTGKGIVDALTAVAMLTS